MHLRLAGILHADVVGYSRLIETNEEGTYCALKSGLDLLSQCVTEHDGRVVNTAGDALLAEFASVVSAALCAITVQRRLAARTPGDSAVKLDFRIGVHLGDVILDGDNILGDGVNVAARLQAMADVGGVCISRTVFNQVCGKLDVGFQCLGEKSLKNIVEPVVVYRVLLDPADAGRVVLDARAPIPSRRRLRWVRLVGVLLGVAVVGAAIWTQSQRHTPAGTATPTAVTHTGVNSGKPFIAVLPFDNLTSDHDQDYFGDGITEDIIAALGRFSELTVIGRETAFQWKDKRPAPRQLSRELGVRYVLEVSVRRSGDAIRVTAQLTDAERGTHLWSERYDGTANDIFAVQDDITQHVAGTLAIRISQLEREHAAAKPPGALRAYDYALRGRAALARSTSSDNFEARRLFQKAIALDPAYAAAYTDLARTYYYAVSRGWTEFVQDDIDAAERFAQQALRLDATDAGARQVWPAARGELSLRTCSSATSRRAWTRLSSIHARIGCRSPCRCECGRPGGDDRHYLRIRTCQGWSHHRGESCRGEFAWILP
jgi:adenylate cyclase